MSKLRDAAAVAKACKCEGSAVLQAIPHIIDALNEQGILRTNVVIAAYATVATECSFRPVEEAFYLSESKRIAYFDKSAYGKLDPKTGKRYYGRGFIQLTWRGNYERYGKALGVDLVNKPELALNPKIAARILALYFKQRAVDIAADEGDWRAVRRLVNGGYNGIERFMQCVDALKPLGSE